MRKTWLHYAKWSKKPKFKPAWSIKTPRKRSPVECNFDHVSHSGLFLGKSLYYWDILWTTLEHYIDRTMVHELGTANNYFCIYEKIKVAPFFWPTLYDFFFEKTTLNILINHFGISSHFCYQIIILGPAEKLIVWNWFNFSWQYHTIWWFHQPF